MQEVIQDPSGFEVILTEICWIDHIVKNHPEMAQHRGEVLNTLKQPDGIYKGKRDNKTRIYLKKYHLTEDLGKWLDLLVFVGDDHRHVKTAYFAAYSFRALGDMIWPTQ